MAYLGRSTDGFGVRDRFGYTAAGSETSVSGADEDADAKKVNKKVPGFIMPGMAGYCIKVITRMAGEKVFGSVSITMVKQQALVITKMERRMVCGKTSLILVCCQM